MVAMAGTELATAYVSLSVSTQGMGRDIRRAFSGVDSQASSAGRSAGRKMSKEMGGGLGSLKGIIGKLGIAGAAFKLGSEVGGAFTDGIKGAADVEQSRGAIAAIFKKDVKQIEKASKQAATSLGLSENAYNELASTIGAGLNNKGIKDYADQTQNMISLGADLAAQFGGSTQEAVEAMSSLMRGEADPIERYGVSINETAINAYLAAKGQDKLKGAALDQAKAQARLALVYQQTKDAQGTFARESETFAGKQQRAGAQWEDLKTKIGEMFLPSLTSAMGFISGTAIPKLAELGDTVESVTSYFKKEDGSAMSLSQALGIGLNEDSALADQIDKLEGGFGGLAAEGRKLSDWANNDLKPALEELGGRFRDLWATVEPIARQISEKLFDKFKENEPQIRAAMESMQSAITSALSIISSVVGSATAQIKVMWDVFGPAILSVLGTTFDTAVALFTSMWDTISAVFETVAAAFRGDWDGVWQGLKDVFAGLGDQMAALLSFQFNIVGDLFKNLGWGATLRGHFEGMKKNVRDTWATITGTINAKINEALTLIRNTWGTITGTVSGFLSRIVTNVRDRFNAIRTKISDTMWAIRSTISNVGESIKATFRGIVDGAGRIWDGLKAKAAAPIRFVIDTVFNNGLRKAYNSLASTFKIGQLPEVKAGFARGGILPGQSSWRGGDTHLRPMREGEGVYVSEAMRDPVERARLFAINAAAMAGRSLDSVRARFGEGFAKGGVVQPVPGRGNRHSGYGWATWAGDFPVPMGTPIHAWKDGVIAAVKYLTTSYGKHVRINHTDGTSSLYAHMSKIIAATVGQVVKAGQTIGLVGSTGNSSGPHLHFETMGGPYNGGGSAATGGGGFDPLGMLTSSFAGPLAKLKGLGDSPIAELAKSFPAKVVELAKDKIKSVAASVMDVAGSAIDTAGIAARYSPLIIKHLLKNGMPLSLTDNMLRQIKSESGGNPGAVQQVRDVNWPNNKAVGLLQIIPGTFATYRDPSLPNDRTNAEASIAASIRYIKSRYGSRAESVIGHGHGYASGTTNASRGLHWVGEQGPELMSFRGGETVIPTRQSFEIAGLAQQMQGAGREVVAGFILGVNGGSDQVAAAARYLAATTTNAAKAELGIASPSKVFTQVGRWVGEGLAKGVKGTTKQIESTMKTLRTNMEKVWSQKNATSKKGAVAYWTKEVKRLKTLAKKNKSYTGQLKAAETNLGKARKGDTYAGVAAKWDGFNKRVSKINAGLKKNADQRTKITDQIKSAQTRLTEATKARDEFAYNVWKGASESASVTGQSGDTWADFYGSLKGKLSGWKTFTTDMAQLRKLGLGNRAYEELVNAGPEQGGKIAKMLLGAGKGGIKEVNALQAQISRAGSVFGNQAAGVLYQPGVDAANGLIKGLQSKQKELDKIGTSLAQSLVKAVRKELKIKSPSRVMFDQGAYTGEGMALGMESMEARVAAAGAGLASAAVPGRPISTVDHAVSISGGREFHIYIGDKEVTDLVRVEYDRRDKQAGRQVAMTGIGGGL